MTTTADRDSVWTTEFVPILGKLRDHAGRLASTPEDAEDLYAESMARVWKYLGSYRVGSSPTNWAMRIVSNEHARHDKMRVHTVLVPEIPEFIHPTEEHAFADLSPEMQDALKSLPPDMGTVVWLTTVCDLTNAEVAKRMNVPVGTIHSRKERAKLLLRAALTGLANEQDPVEPIEDLCDN